MKYLNLKNALLAAYAVALGFFLGQLFFDIPGLPWPYNVIAGYTLGALVGGFISFELFGKWQRRTITKIITAIILLIITAFVVTRLTALEMTLIKMQLSAMYP